MYIHFLLLFSNIVLNEKFKNNINFCQELDVENSADEAEKVPASLITNQRTHLIYQS